MPLTNQPVYIDWIKEADYEKAKYINDNGLLVGCHHFLTKKDIDYIIQALNEFYEIY